MTDFTKEAAELLFSLWARADGSSPENDAEDIPIIANALAAAEKRGREAEQERWSSEALRYARFYDPNTDGQNTFMMFAEATRK